MSSFESPSQAPAAQHGTRRSLLVAAGVTAALAGSGVAWWQGQSSGNDTDRPGDPAPAGFWDAQWDAPGGGKVAMQSLAGRPLLLNFWATWCPPCIEELPLINAFYVKNKSNGWQVLALAVDKLAAVQAFLQKSPLDFPVGMAAMAGTELGRSLGNLTGGLPFTVIFGAGGSVLHRKMGRVSPDDLAQWSGLK